MPATIWMPGGTANNSEKRAPPARPICEAWHFQNQDAASERCLQDPTVFRSGKFAALSSYSSLEYEHEDDSGADGWTREAVHQNSLCTLAL